LFFGFCLSLRWLRKHKWAVSGDDFKWTTISDSQATEGSKDSNTYKIKNKIVYRLRHYIAVNAFIGSRTASVRKVSKNFVRMEKKKNNTKGPGKFELKLRRDILKDGLCTHLLPELGQDKRSLRFGCEPVQGLHRSITFISQHDGRFN
jgi:predicted XRE-type DNA-binding protein